MGTDSSHYDPARYDGWNFWILGDNAFSRGINGSKQIKILPMIACV